jgi:hypothetical protein
VHEMKENVDPTEGVPRASIETAMHAVLPPRSVLHVQCVNTIARAVRQDSPVQLEHVPHGLRWQWIPCVPSGLTLAREIQRVLSILRPHRLLILGNHRLVLGGDDCSAVENLLSDVKRRLTICPRMICYLAFVMQIRCDFPTGGGTVRSRPVQLRPIDRLYGKAHLSRAAFPAVRNS